MMLVAFKRLILLGLDPSWAWDVEERPEKVPGRLQTRRSLNRPSGAFFRDPDGGLELKIGQTDRPKTPDLGSP